MFKWQKIGRIFDPTTIKNLSWIKEFAQAPSVLIFDKFIRVYFSCRPLPDKNGQYISNSAYIDLDKNNFEIINIAKKPILNLGGPGSFDEFGIYPVSAIFDDNEILLYYAGWTRCESVPFNVAIGMAKSVDGEEFIKQGNGPVLSYSIDEPFVLSGPKIRKFNNKYYLFYIAGKKWIISDNKPEPVYKIRLAISDDGINWKKINKDLIDSRIEENEAQASPDVIYKNGKYHMFFCYRYSENYRGKDGGYRIGYAYSYNLVDWTRDDSSVGIDISDDGWDSEMISYPHVFELNGNIYMFYLGNQVGKFGFGAAKLDGDL